MCQTALSLRQLVQIVQVQTTTTITTTTTTTTTATTGACHLYIYLPCPARDGLGAVPPGPEQVGPPARRLDLQAVAGREEGGDPAPLVIRGREAARRRRRREEGGHPDPEQDAVVLVLPAGDGLVRDGALNKPVEERGRRERQGAAQELDPEPPALAVPQARKAARVRGLGHLDRGRDHEARGRDQAEAEDQQDLVGRPERHVVRHHRPSLRVPRRAVPLHVAESGVRTPRRPARLQHAVLPHRVAEPHREVGPDAEPAVPHPDQEQGAPRAEDARVASALRVVDERLPAGLPRTLPQEDQGRHDQHDQQRVDARGDVHVRAEEPDQHHLGDHMPEDDAAALALVVNKGLPHLQLPPAANVAEVVVHEDPHDAPPEDDAHERPVREARVAPAVSARGHRELEVRGVVGHVALEVVLVQCVGKLLEGEARRGRKHVDDHLEHGRVREKTAHRRQERKHARVHAEPDELRRPVQRLEVQDQRAHEPGPAEGDEDAHELFQHRLDGA